MKYILFLFALLAVPVGGLHAQDLTGAWQGTLEIQGNPLRLIFKVTRADDALMGVMYSIDQTPQPFNTGAVTLQGGTAKIEVPSIGGTFEGKMTGSTIVGTWNQGPVNAGLTIGIGKNGPKLTKNESDPNGLPGLGFRGLGAMIVRNATMEDFASTMQGIVLDRPVVDQTELKGRFDFTLNWTPDEFQFASFGSNRPPAPPDLYTAIQEQIGLKLSAGKAPADVPVIDKVEKPPEN